MFNVKNKIVMITGASGGIGLELVKTYLKLGAQVIAIDKSDKLSKIIKKIDKKRRKNLFLINADLTKKEDIDDIVIKSIKLHKRVDVLVNCAGVNIRKELDKYTEDEWDFIHNINVKAVFNFSNKIASIMKEKNKGRIINLSSTQGVSCWNGKGRFSLAPYCSSKASVIALTKAFALDLAKYGITVNAVCPAFVNTKLVRPVKNDKELYEDIINRSPIGRFAKIKEIVYPIIFLSSDESSYITGHSLMVDGGWTIE